MLHKILFISTLFLPSFSIEISASNNNELPQWGILDWFPFGWQESNKTKGMFIDLVPLVDETLGSNSEAILASVSRSIRGTQEGNFDFTITYRDEMMMDKVNYLVDIGCLKTAIISLKTASIHKISDLNGKRVAYPSMGYFSANVLPALSLKGIETPRSDMMVNMALRGRIDAFVINDAVWGAYKAGLYKGLEISDTKLQEFAAPLFMKTLPIAISTSHKSKHTELANKIKGIMKNRVFVERLEKLYAKYNYHDTLSCLPNTS